MKIILNAEQMKECDSYTSEYFGIPSIVLMERAALSVCDAMVAYCGLDESKRVLVLCGTGNNGADGLALARILNENGISAEYCVPVDGGKHSELFDKQREILEKYEIHEVPVSKDIAKLKEYDIIVDALFGIGLSRDLSEEICACLELVNSADACRVAVDIASGISADTGAVMGAAFKADLTVTFGFAKLGQVIFPGKAYTGKLVVTKIGITQKALSDKDTFLMEEKDWVCNYPIRPEFGNKGTFGKVLIFAGSLGMTGACIMSAKAAFRAGCGMVRILTCEENVPVIMNAIPEAMVTAFSYKEGKLKLGEEVGNSSDEKACEIEKLISWADVILAGPGIGNSKESKLLLKTLIEVAGNKDMVIDADGLNIISENEELKESMAKRDGFTVLTPHIGELARLVDKKPGEVKQQYIAEAKALANELSACIVAKDAVTAVTDGTEVMLISSGNSGMATAGSGDVLAGVIAANLAFAASGKSAGDKNWAVLNSVYLHGYAGSLCTESMPEDSLMAGDIIEALPSAIARVRKMQK